MNVLVIGKFHDEGFGLHIAETLSGMGHNVARFEPGARHLNARAPIAKRLEQVARTLYDMSDAMPAVSAWRARALHNAVDKSTPELIVVCHDFLWPQQVRELKRRTRAKIVMWFPDPLSYFGRAKFLLAPYDAVFFKDPYIVRALRGVADYPIYYLPECFNPARHRLPEAGQIDWTPYRCDITTAGNLHAYRIAFFSKLQRYNLKIWGNPPPIWADAPWLKKAFQGRFVANEEKAMAFCGARIVVNNLLPGEISGINVRAFEAAGVGAFQLIDWRPGLTELFEDSRELVSFKGMDDLIGKIDYFLTHDAEHDQIRKAGQSRAHRDHTYERRLQLLVDTVSGTKQGYPSSLA